MQLIPKIRFVAPIGPNILLESDRADKKSSRFISENILQIGHLPSNFYFYFFFALFKTKAKTGTDKL